MSHILKKLEETNQPIIVKDVLPLKTNIEILKYLSQAKWQIARDNEDSKQHNRLSNAFADDIYHKGWVYDLNNDETLNLKGSFPLQIYSDIIIDIVTNKLNILKFEIRRVMYNYYNINQKGIEHQDYEDDESIAILYNIHKTDGGTMINNKFFEDAAGEAKVFKCNWIHKGIGPKIHKARSNLNICIGIK